MQAPTRQYEAGERTRSKLLKRLAATGYEVTPLTDEEYSQMTIAECRDHVRACEKQIAIPQNVDQAVARGFIFESSVGKGSARGKRVRGKALFVLRIGDSHREIVIPFASRYLYGTPRVRRSGEML